MRKNSASKDAQSIVRLSCVALSPSTALYRQIGRTRLLTTAEPTLANALCGVRRRAKRKRTASPMLQHAEVMGRGGLPAVCPGSRAAQEVSSEMKLITNDKIRVALLGAAGVMLLLSAMFVAFE